MFELDALNRSILDNIHEGAYILDNNKIITYWNKSAERITGYTFNEVVGKCCKDDVLTHFNEQGVNLCNGLCPVSMTLSTGVIETCDAYLSHKEGYSVPVSISVIPVKNAAGHTISAIQIFTDNQQKNLSSEKKRPKLGTKNFMYA